MSKYFSEEHEWILVDGDIATVGITEHAAKLLGDVVFVELNDAGDEFEKGDERMRHIFQSPPRLVPKAR